MTSALVIKLSLAVTNGEKKFQLNTKMLAGRQKSYPDTKKLVLYHIICWIKCWMLAGVDTKCQLDT